MGAHTGGSRCNPSTSTARRSAVVSRGPSPTSADARKGNKARTKAACRERWDMEVRRKMEVLRRLVPSGGSGAGDDEVDELLLRAAGYIARLQAQVTVMQFMVEVLEDTKD